MPPIFQLALALLVIAVLFAVVAHRTAQAVRQQVARQDAAQQKALSSALGAELGATVAVLEEMHTRLSSGEYVPMEEHLEFALLSSRRDQLITQLAVSR